MTASSGRKVLMACLEYWGSPFQLAGQHLARAFLRAGWDVAYVSVPISPIHLAAGWSDSLRTRFRSYRQGGISDADGRLWSYVPGAILTPRGSPVLRSRWLMDGWWRLTVPNVVRHVRRRGFGRPDLLYIDSSVQGFWLNEVRPDVSVLRVADRLDGFAHVPRSQVDAERRLAGRVDLVVHAAWSLADHVAAMGARRCAYLPNGVDFDTLIRADTSLPDDLARIPRPRALYAGATGPWFDAALVNRLARRLPDVSFVVIGGDEGGNGRLERLPNLYPLGRRPWTEMPRYFANADVGLIPFDVESHRALVDGVHPLKLYEYLAFGLPVVATRWKELELLASPAILCRDEDGFVAAIRHALDDPGDAHAALAFARSASWDARLATLLEATGLS